MNRKVLLVIGLIIIAILGFFLTQHKNQSNKNNKRVPIDTNLTKDINNDTNITVPNGTLFTINDTIYKVENFPNEYKNISEKKQKVFVSKFIYYKLFLDTLKPEINRYKELIEKNIKKNTLKLKRKGIHPNNIQKFINRQQITLNTIVEQKILKNRKNIEKDIIDLYNKHKKDFYLPNRIEISHIVVKEQNIANKIIESMDKNSSLYNFAKLSERYNIGKSKYSAGYIGEVDEEKIGKDIFKKLWSAEENTIFPTPIKDKGFYYIVYIFKKSKEGQRTLEDEKENIRNFILKKEIGVWKFKKFKKIKKKYTVNFYNITIQ
jgi:peptidyl-prolyl cis-trans isomerase C